MTIEKIGVEMEGGIVDEEGFAKFTHKINGQDKKIFDIIHQASPKDLQAQMKPEIFANMVELVTGSGSVESIKKEAVQLRKGLEEVTEKLGFILSRQSIYPVRPGSQQVLSREEIYGNSFNKVRALNPEAEFNARTLGLHVHMNGVTDEATLQMLFALNNHYADLRPNRESSGAFKLTKERFDAWKILVDTRNKLGEKHGGFLPTRFATLKELLTLFFGTADPHHNGEYPSPIESHRIVTMKKPGKRLTVEDRHPDCPLDADKIGETIDTVIQNVAQAEKKFTV